MSSSVAILAQENLQSICSSIEQDISLSDGGKMPYALCKHGPHCRMHHYGACGFAHNLHELGIPTFPVSPRIFRDASEKRQGHAGIDRWFGQEMTQTQKERLWKYIRSEQDPYPEWVRMFIWFHTQNDKKYSHGDHMHQPSLPPRTDRHEAADFNVLVHLKRLAQHMTKEYRTTLLPITDPRELFRWNPIFVWATDTQGINFLDRLKQRMEQKLTYTLWTAETDTSESYTSKIAPYTFREAGKKYLQVDKGDLYVLVVQGHGVMQAYWWLSRYDNADSQECEVCGWAKKCHFAFVAEEVSTWVRSVPPVSDFGPN
jgi:hypothetical protein